MNKLMAGGVMFALVLLWLPAGTGHAGSGSTLHRTALLVFHSLPELREWACHSTFGGGFFLLLPGKEVTYGIADRSFTSGMVSSGPVIFRKSGSKYVMVYQLPLRYVSRKYVLSGGDIIVSEHAGGKKTARYVIREKDLRFSGAVP